MLEIMLRLLNDPAFTAQVNCSTIKFQAHEKILEQGRIRKYVYLIRAGKVRISISPNDKEQQYLHPGIAELRSGDTFGEFGLFDDQPLASADATAITDCELIAIDILTFRWYLDKNPNVGYMILLEILKMFIKQLHGADKTILALYMWGMKAHKLDKYLNEDNAKQEDTADMRKDKRLSLNK